LSYASMYYSHLPYFLAGTLVVDSETLIHNLDLEDTTAFGAQIGPVTR